MYSEESFLEIFSKSCPKTQRFSVLDIVERKFYKKC